MHQYTVEVMEQKIHELISIIFYFTAVRAILHVSPIIIMIPNTLNSEEAAAGRRVRSSCKTRKHCQVILIHEKLQD